VVVRARTVIRAASGHPLSRSERAFFKSVAGGRDPPKQPVKELWVLVGRRAGKDSVASAVVAHMAAAFEPTGLPRPGERATRACLAVDQRQARIVHSYVRGYFQQVPSLAAMVTRETADGLELSNSVDVEIVTSNYRGVRGRTYLAVIMDEVAFWRDEDSSVNPDLEIYRSLRPGMTTLPQSLLVGITSVYRRSGLAYERYAQYFGKPSDRILVIHAPSRLLNPTLDQAEVDAALAEDPVGARADHLSEWRDDLSSFIPRDLLEACIDRGVTVRPRQPGVHHLAYLDAAEGMSASGDSYSAAIAHREGDNATLDWLLEVRPPFNPATVTQQIAEVLTEYRIAEIMGDRHAAGFVIDQLSKSGKRFLECELDRSDLYLELLPIISAGRIRLLDSDRLINQFCNLERRTIAGGRDRVGHPRGGHDDAANSAAGALWRASARKGRWSFRLAPSGGRASPGR
jgi:hypothetical protein